MFATLIFLIACLDPGRKESITSRMVLKMCRVTARKEERGFTSVVMLGSTGLLMCLELVADR